VFVPGGMIDAQLLSDIVPRQKMSCPPRVPLLLSAAVPNISVGQLDRARAQEGEKGGGALAEEGPRNLICNMPEREVDCDALQVVYSL